MWILLVICVLQLYVAKAVEDQFGSFGKVLVIVYGSLRGGPAAWASLNRFIVDYYKADLALLSPPITNALQMKYLGKRAKYTWPVHEYGLYDWGVVLDEAVTDANEKGRWMELCNHGASFLGASYHCNDGDALNANSSAGILLALRYLASVKIQKLRLEQEYDWFVYTRSDYVYLCSPPPIYTLRNDTMHIPRGESWFGYTDRYSITPSRLVLRSLNVTADIVNDWRTWVTILTTNPKEGKGLRMIEWCLGKYYAKSGIEVTTFVHTGFTVQSPEDESRFALSTHDSILQHYNLRVKYHREKIEAEEGKQNASHF